jgi:hypothetical protein
VNVPQLKDGSVKIVIRAAYSCNKKRHAILIQFYAGKTVATFFSI